MTFLEFETKQKFCSHAAKTGKHLSRTQNVSEKKIRNIFFVPRTEILFPQQMLRAGANRETFVSATMCPQSWILFMRQHIVSSFDTTLTVTKATRSHCVRALSDVIMKD